MVYDIQRGWIYLIPAVTSSSGGIEFSLGGTEPGSNSRPGSAARTPLSAAPTPHMAASTSTSRGRSTRAAAAAAKSRISRHFGPTGRLVMPECLRDDDSISAMLEQGTLEPLTYKQARLRPDSDEWAEAEDIEWGAILSYGTFKWITYDRTEEMYKINPFARVISTKWCYNRKPDRHKARVVARGFLQSPWDVGETHSNVAKLSTVRALLSKAA
jgi:hypothetical protein